jgi:PAS domain S-box-containing protein
MLEEEITRKEFERIKEDLDDLKLYIEEFSVFLPLAVYTINPLGRVINTNKAVEDLTGYLFSEVMGELVADFFLEKEEIKKITAEIGEKGLIKNKELTLVTREGKRILVSASISRRRDSQENYIGYFLAISDITELKVLQENLEEKVKERTQELEDEKNKTFAVINNFTDGILVFNKKDELLLANPKAKEFSDVLPFNNLIEIYKKETKEIFRKELNIKEDLILEMTVVPLKGETEKLGNLIILHDITREKLVDKIKTEFVTLAAHQLRTPLSSIKWIFKMLMEGDFGKINKEQKDFIIDGYRSNERMIFLVNDLLNVARIEEGRYIYDFILTNPKELIRSIMNFHKDKAREKKIKFKLNRTVRKLPEIMVDVEKIKIAIDNIVDNAIKYTHSGGKVTLSLRRDKNKIEFSVKDTGFGISKEQHKRMFTKFFRGANAIRTETEGSGLGLFIAKNIIKIHGGDVWFESKEGKGTTFYFTIPVKNK